MLYVGLDLSRQRLDVHVLDEDGRTVEVTAVRPDAEALRALAARVLRHGHEVSGAIESMTGARFVHDTLERWGWEVEIADAAKVKGIAPLAAKTDRIDAWVLAELARLDLVPAIWLPEPWTATLTTSLAMIDELDARIDACEAELRALGAEHPSIPLLLTVPGVGWVLGTPERSMILPNYVGRADPSMTNEPEHTGVTSSLSPDGAILYIGWVVEQPPVWRGGIDVVDLAIGQVVQTLALPDVPTQVASASVYVAGARVTVAPGGTLAMIGRSMWYSGTGTQGSWHATASVRGGHLGPLSALAGGAGGLDGGNCAGSGGPAGFASATTYFEICSGDSGAIVRRVDVSGRPLGDTVLGGNTAVRFGLGTVVDPAHHLLYVWDPFDRHLLRVDMTTGQITGRGALPAAAASSDPLADAAHAFAAWLAPAVAAKMYLNPSLAISPDGSRLFALGTATADPLAPGGGSTGVWVFAASSLQSVAHWAPVADYVSLTLNRDGSLLLVAGMPGADAAGNSNDQAASVTIYDATTGAVRAIAGQVQPNSAGWVMFPSRTP